MKKNQVLVALGLMLSLGMASVQAQQATQQTPQAPVAPAAKQAALESNYSDQEWQTFAKAVLKVDEVVQSYRPKLASITQQDQVQKLQQEANTEMVKAVEQQGLSAEQYNKMHQALQQNPVLVEKVKGYMK